MARPKEFDTERALDKALQVFWCQGYEATSIQNLVDAMGINRQSLYDTFGDKHALYLATLDHYQRQGSPQLRALLEEEAVVLVAIRRFFEAIVDEAVADPQRRGCFVANSVIELAPHDRDVEVRVNTALDGNEDVFYQALYRAQQAGELTAERDSRQLAQFLVNTLLGLRVMAKANPDQQVLHNIVRTTLTLLD